MSERTIEERASFLVAVKWTPEQNIETGLALEWLLEYPEEAAMYIVWLEQNHE